ncbi:MAG: DUF1800 domain-containing protein [SAR202 cluster bacterium]|nr:DUF1800 domain-containing protein [SAR202 cluster bacterium]MQG66378.1 DUF1800 domain-containing protein [SAR202 cluster bacterium]|tara:strand:+ start:1332 stop:2735 length:1404 start_codon:yes stop_codon:yes gene_type:complete
MATNDLALKAHLLRRAGFGASRFELEQISDKSYEEIVEDLIHPERFEEIDEDYLKRYNPENSYHDGIAAAAGRWIWLMINTKRPLEEKMTLFWHHIFATGSYKGDHTPSTIRQIQTFRENGLTNIKQILLDLAKDPSMNYWLDNCENHSDQPNENWGRELLELFSMGVGNYSEDDVKQAARAFTGWTFEQPLPLYPYGHYETKFVFNESDHDNSEKTFLGRKGNFNGEDIIDIICEERATALFICRHLYNFFVEDEAQVPAWSIEPPRNPEAVDTMIDILISNDGEIRPVLSYMFNSDFFKNSFYKKVKNPSELVAGTLKLSGRYSVVLADGENVGTLYGTTAVMGQALMNPPTVEGWHTGHEWIDGGTLNERVNFAVNQFNDVSSPGFRDILERLGPVVESGDLVDRCLDLIGPIEVGEETRIALSKYAEEVGDVNLGTNEDKVENAQKIARMIQLIVSTREYQFA